MTSRWNYLQIWFSRFFVKYCTHWIYYNLYQLQNSRIVQKLKKILVQNSVTIVTLKPLQFSLHCQNPFRYIWSDSFMLILTNLVKSTKSNDIMADYNDILRIHFPKAGISLFPGVSRSCENEVTSLVAWCREVRVPETPSYTQLKHVITVRPNA